MVKCTINVLHMENECSDIKFLQRGKLWFQESGRQTGLDCESNGWVPHAFLETSIALFLIAPRHQLIVAFVNIPFASAPFSEIDSSIWHCLLLEHLGSFTHKIRDKEDVEVGLQGMSMCTYKHQ